MILRDLLLFPLWVVGWTGNKFVWRGNAMDIKDEGTPLRRLCRPLGGLSHGTFGNRTCHRQAPTGEYGAGQRRTAERLMEMRK